MHRFFEPLNETEAMLLLTTLTVGGSDSVSIFAHWPNERRALVEEKAAALLQIDSVKRVRFMVKEMKDALSFGGASGVEKIDASWILEGMHGESPRIVAAILINLPSATVRTVLKQLPSGVRKRLPPKDELNSVHPEVLKLVRQLFDSRFYDMPERTSGAFHFRDIAQLSLEDLDVLTRDLGLVELGQAFVSVGKMALAELCRRLPRDKAEELILAVKGASDVDVPELKSAQRFLSRVVVNFKDTEEFFRNAGLWRLAKASLHEDGEFRLGFAQRFPRDIGELFQSFVEKASEMDDLDQDILYRTQDSILLRFAELAQRGKLDAKWKTVQLWLHRPRT